MLIRACFKCKFHKVKQCEEAPMSYCQKECCWARFSKCITTKAVERFLNEECVISESVLT